MTTAMKTEKVNVFKYNLIEVLLMYSESSTGRCAVLQRLCCPNNQGELSENMLQTLFHNRLMPQTEWKLC